MRLFNMGGTGRPSLISGGQLYLNSNYVPAWFYEASGRAGGLMQTRQYNQDATPRSGDVVWISYTASTYQNAVKIAARLAPQKTMVVAFGPHPPGERPPFQYWVDSQTSWTADDNLTLLGNVLSLWTMHGELAAATARQGRTLVFWQSIQMPSAADRNKRYSDQLFHDGFPQMKAIDAGGLSLLYLDAVAAVLADIAKTELPHIAEAGRQVAQQNAAGDRPTLVVTSHLLPFIGVERSALFRYVANPAELDDALFRSRFVVNIGYSGVDLELWRKVRTAGAKAVWITGQLPNQADFSGQGDLFIDQHWQLGDAAVPVAGYDVRLLPVSGVAQLFIYELLVRSAGGQ